MIAVDLDDGRFLKDEEVRDMLSARFPYGAWTAGIKKIDHIVKTDAPEPVYFQGESVASPPACRWHDLGRTGNYPAPDGGGCRRGHRAAWATTRRLLC